MLLSLLGLARFLITTKLGLESTVHLQNMCQSAQVIAYLVQQFGNGVLVFLPPGAGNKYGTSIFRQLMLTYKAAPLGRTTYGCGHFSAR
jgi:hypothetical protein